MIYDDDYYAGLGLIPSARRVPIPDSPQDIAGVLEPALRSVPDREALVGRHSRYTYAELDAAVARTAAALAGLGVRQGDRVGASLANHPEIVIAFLAAQRLGAIWVGLNRVLTVSEKSFMLRDAGVSVLLAEAAAIPELAPVRDTLPDLRHVVDADAGVDSSWARLVREARPQDVPAVDIDPWAPAVISYTSGTTGFPKGVVHSQHNMLTVGAAMLWHGRGTSEMRRAVCIALTTSNFFASWVLATFLNRSTLICIDQSKARGIAEWIEKEQIETMTVMPATLSDMLLSPEIDPRSLRSLTRLRSGGSAVPETLRDLYRERFGQEIQNSYGLTEAPAFVTEPPPDRIVRGASGQAIEHLTVTIVDDDDNELGVGEHGEICIGPSEEGPWAGVYTTMLGYWRRPEETRATLRGGRTHTGDIGYLDRDGNLFVVDRKKELIIRGGSNIYPAEVERVIMSDMRVRGCAVVGRPDERLGEVPVAFVEPVPGAAADGLVEELKALCARELSKYKVPVAWHVVDEFPRNSMNKIRKKELLGMLPQREGAR